MISSKTGILSLTIASLLTALPAQKTQLKDAMPIGSALCVSIPDIRSTLSELRNMPVGKMWQEGEVQDFLADTHKWLTDSLQEVFAEGARLHDAGDLPIDPASLKNLELRSIAFGVTDVTLAMPEGATEPMPDFGMYVLIDFGDSIVTWRQLAERMLTEVVKQAPPGMTEVVNSMIGEVELTTIQPTIPDIEMSLNVAYIGNSILIGTRLDETRQIIANLNSGTRELSASAEYKQVNERLSLPGAETEFYFQPGACIDFVMDAVSAIASQPQVPDTAREILDPEGLERAIPQVPNTVREILDPEGLERAITAMGLRAFKGYGSSSTYTGGRCVTRSYSNLDPQLRRGITAYTEANLDLGFLRWIPKDAVSFAASTIDVGAYYDALTDGLDAFNPDMAKMVMGMLQGFEQQLGVNLKDDLFGSFGDHYITWSMPMSGLGATPEMSILIAIDDQEQLMKALKVAETMSNGYLEIDEIERRGFKAHQIHVNMPESAGFMAVNPLDMFTPTFVFKNGYMVIGFTTGDVKRTLKRMDRNDDPSGDIRSNEEFSPYIDKLPGSGLSCVSFTDWKATFEGMYQMATGMLAFVPMNADVPIDLALLPDSYTLTQHLCGAIAWTLNSPSGQETMSISPWGLETWLAPVVGGIAGAAFYGANWHFGGK